MIVFSTGKRKTTGFPHDISVNGVSGPRRLRCLIMSSTMLRRQAVGRPCSAPNHRFARGSCLLSCQGGVALFQDGYTCVGKDER